jgi:UDP-galactopyranose mutase
MDKKELLKKFILHKVEVSTNEDKPYFIVRWSGLNELAKSLGYDLIEVIDEMVDDKLIKKALIDTKKGKALAIYLPKYQTIVSRKAKEILKEFKEFITQEKK